VIGFGALRLPDDEAAAEDVLRAAIAAGATWIDTARAYGNEALVGRVAGAARIATKCGMVRDGWIPDGRAASIARDAAASVAALGRVPDVLLLHAVDPKVPLATSVRALERARREGLTRGIGLSNVTRRQLEQIDVPLAAVEVAVGPYDDEAARGGVLAWCRERNVTILAHAPFGGPKRAARLGRDGILKGIAAKHGATPYAVMLAYLVALGVVPIPGSGRVDHAAALAIRVSLDAADLSALDARFPGLLRRPPTAPRVPDAEVVMIMGLPGAGKSRLATGLGGVRFNRDALGGTLRGITKRLGEALAQGAPRVVLDNTYLTRASRSDVLRVAHAHAAAVRCVHLTIDPRDARLNVVGRMFDTHGALLGGPALVAAAREDAGTFMPGSFSRMERQLEVPGADEGFAAIETRAFVREPGSGRGALVVPFDVLERAPAIVRHDPRPILVYAWGRDVTARALELAGRDVAVGVCLHPGGPPVCWCRPPLPGLWVAFARATGVDAQASELVARSPTHEAMARAIGVRARPLDLA